MIALLSLRGMRLRSLLAMQLGRHLRRDGPEWRIVLEAADVKTGRPLEYPLPAGLTAWMDRYLAVERAELLAGQHRDAVWIGFFGKPLRRERRPACDPRALGQTVRADARLRAAPLPALHRHHRSDRRPRRSRRLRRAARHQRQGPRAALRPRPPRRCGAGLPSGLGGGPRGSPCGAAAPRRSPGSGAGSRRGAANRRRSHRDRRTLRDLRAVQFRPAARGLDRRPAADLPRPGRAGGLASGGGAHRLPRSRARPCCGPATRRCCGPARPARSTSSWPRASTGSAATRSTSPASTSRRASRGRGS